MASAVTPRASRARVGASRLDAVRALVTCPICLDPFADAHCVTTCGHTFCHACARAALEASTSASGGEGERWARCPTCSSTFTEAHLVPNAAVNGMVSEMRRLLEEEEEARADDGEAEDELERLTPIVKSLSEKHRVLVLESRAASHEVLKEFLLESRARKEASAAALERELLFLNSDIQAVRQEIQLLSGGSAQAMETTRERGDGREKEVIARAMEALGLTKMGELVIDESKRRRVLRQFNELQNWYSRKRTNDMDEDEVMKTLGDGALLSPDSTTMEEFSALIDTFKRFSNITVAAELAADADATASCAPISSIEFDASEENFATAGVSKRIQFYNLGRVLEGSQQPADEITTRSKLTCLSYNKFVRQHIAASDNEGVVSVWDVEKKCAVIEFEEHEKRIWTVDYCRTDPRLLVSGSDDYLVKIWNVDQPSSVHEIDMKANVCCAQYSPEDAHCIAVSCVNQMAYIFDLRRLAEPLHVLDGHRKAVSYVKYLNAHEVATASTDNSINVWNVNSGELKCTLKGHLNERNFVGLTTAGDHIACGSESNEVFLYRKDLPTPITSINFARDPVEGPAEARGFISACTWKSDDSVLVAANSNGIVKVFSV